MLQSTMMPRPSLEPSELRQKISISPDPRVLAWADANVGLGKRFRNRTHAFEYAVFQLMARSRDEQDRGEGGDRRRS